MAALAANTQQGITQVQPMAWSGGFFSRPSSGPYGQAWKDVGLVLAVIGGIVVGVWLVHQLNVRLD